MIYARNEYEVTAFDTKFTKTEKEVKELINKSTVLKLIEDIKCDNSIPKNYGTLLDIMRAIRKLPTSNSFESECEKILYYLISNYSYEIASLYSKEECIDDLENIYTNFGISTDIFDNFRL